MSWAAIFLQLLRILDGLLALLRSRREREAGRLEADLERRSANDAAIEKAAKARADARLRDLGSDGLRADDGFRRD